MEVTETTRGEFAASVVQSDMEPGHLGEGAHALQRALVRLREETDAAKRRALAVRLERGARRRLQYTHWAVSQLLSTGPILPIEELSEEQLEAELTWAVAAEREAAFTVLRPLLRSTSTRWSRSSL